MRVKLIEDTVCDGSLARADRSHHHDGVVTVDELRHEVIVTDRVNSRDNDLVEWSPVNRQVTLLFKSLDCIDCVAHLGSRLICHSVVI